MSNSEQQQTMKNAKCSQIYYKTQGSIIKTKSWKSMSTSRKSKRRQKLFLKTRKKNQLTTLVINLDQYDEILKRTNISSMGPDKNSYNILKRLPKSFESYICLLITSSINNSYTPIMWKESQAQCYRSQTKTKKRQKISINQLN